LTSPEIKAFQSMRRRLPPAWQLDAPAAIPGCLPAAGPSPPGYLRPCPDGATSALLCISGPKKELPMRIKTLLLSLILMFVTPIALAADPAQENSIAKKEAPEKKDPAPPATKNPAPPKVRLSFDFRARQIFQENVFTLNDDAPNTDWDWQRYRFRGGLSFTPVKNIDVNTRVTWEFRNYNKFVNPNLDWDKSYAMFDRLNITMKNVFNQPLTITAGRQDIMLDSLWLVMDATPGDGSRTIYFDAVRADYAFKQIDSVLKVIYIDQGAEAEYMLPTWKSPDVTGASYLVEENQKGGIFHFTNKSVRNTELNAYFMTKDTEARSSAGWTGDTHVFGGRVVVTPNSTWQLYGEAALQKGDRNGRDVSAFGANSALSYKFNDSLANNLKTEYEFLSGDDPNTAEDESFDLMWGRWPRWSELYIYCMQPENGRIGQITNMHRIAWYWGFNPHKTLSFLAAYHLLYADENPVGLTRDPTLISESGSFRGQLITSKLSYNIAKHVPGHFLVEKFLGGDYYSASHPDNALMVRFEIGYVW